MGPSYEWSYGAPINGPKYMGFTGDITPKSGGDTVAGSEIRQTHQLRLLVYLIIYMRFLHILSVVGFGISGCHQQLSPTSNCMVFPGDRGPTWRRRVSKPPCRYHLQMVTTSSGALSLSSNTSRLIRGESCSRGDFVGISSSKFHGNLKGIPPIPTP